MNVSSSYGESRTIFRQYGLSHGPMILALRKLFLIIDLQALRSKQEALLAGGKMRGWVTSTSARLKTTSRFRAVSGFQACFGQPRRTKPLPRRHSARWAEFAAGSKVGSRRVENTTTRQNWLEIPGPILVGITPAAKLGGRRGSRWRNAGHLFMDASHGMRRTTKWNRLAAFEFASTFSFAIRAQCAVRAATGNDRTGKRANLMRPETVCPASTYTFSSRSGRARAQRPRHGEVPA